MSEKAPEFQASVEQKPHDAAGEMDRQIQALYAQGVIPEHEYQEYQTHLALLESQKNYELEHAGVNFGKVAEVAHTRFSGRIEAATLMNS